MSKPLKVLDLFSGLRGWSAPFAARGHETFTIELNERFDADAHIDCGDVDLVLRTVPWRPDVILASPPCTAFTTMTMGKNWTHDGQPKRPTAVEGRRLVLVLDPFGGTGTTAQVANRRGRRAVLIDLNPDYLRQQLRRANAVPIGL